MRIIEILVRLRGCADWYYRCAHMLQCTFSQVAPLMNTDARSYPIAHIFMFKLWYEKFELASDCLYSKYTRKIISKEICGWDREVAGSISLCPVPLRMGTRGAWCVHFIVSRLVRLCSRYCMCNQVYMYCYCFIICDNLASRKHAYIILTPLKPHFYIVKLGFTGVYIIFLISAQKHRLWVLVRTASSRRF